MTHALLAEFDQVHGLVNAVDALREDGFERFETYSPVPVESLVRPEYASRRTIDLTALIAGLAGFAAAFGLATWMSAVQYPLNVGGRPLFSWPAYFLPSFEAAILCAGFGAMIAMFRASGLPRLHNPLFEAPGFKRASCDRFFIAVFDDDPRYASARDVLERAGAAHTREVAV